jgi:ubiquinone/menaquinone biosynthesis C-methylase UbiE
MPALYDSIGRTYTRRRQTDQRIAAAIEEAMDGCASVLNVGAGAGSYEPQSRSVVAVEPSRTMIAQRAATAPPVVQGRAEALPFANESFDAVMGVLTVHHWKDQTKGLAECARVARSRIVILTYDLDVSARFWLFDYLPELLRMDRLMFPPIEKFAEVFGSIESRVLPIPADCCDGFLGAYWKRPRAYLDPMVRSSISTFSKIGNIDSQLARLAGDIDSGEWNRRHSDLQGIDLIDLGYRLLIARK